MSHERDEDCDVDSETDCCVNCGVYHGYACFPCGGRGFHRAGCPEMAEPQEALSADEAAQNVIDAGGF